MGKRKFVEQLAPPGRSEGLIDREFHDLEAQSRRIYRAIQDQQGVRDEVAKMQQALMDCEAEFGGGLRRGRRSVAVVKATNDVVGTALCDELRRGVLQHHIYHG